MSQFVVLRHETPQGVHFDFMLELHGVLKTWALPEQPDAGGEMACEALGDHRLAYLEYEGPISKGRGAVTRWDRGTYAIRQQSDEQWDVELAGGKLMGAATLRRIAVDPRRWVFALAKKHAG
jgi:hypothetical protein